MKLSKTAALAALSMAYLARCDGKGPVQARTVATHLGIPTDSVLKILQALARRGLLQSQLGRSGGYQMHRPPGSVCLLEIVEAIDGPLSSELPVSHDEPAVQAQLIALGQVCDEVADRIRQGLRGISVADLMKRASNRGNGDVLAHVG